ncbi:MAG: hypothetical protein MUF00_09945 [Gemmatimonadaceae bacterium]|nr:hypothetical protein [Gemmatimonadaceae bacterium]
MTTSRLAASQEILAAIDRVSADIGGLSTARLRAIVALLDPTSGTTDTGTILEHVYVDGKSLESRNKSFNALREQFNEAAECAHLAIAVDMPQWADQ